MRLLDRFSLSTKLAFAPVLAIVVVLAIAAYAAWALWDVQSATRSFTEDELPSALAMKSLQADIMTSQFYQVAYRLDHNSADASAYEESLTRSAADLAQLIEKTTEGHFLSQGDVTV